MKRASILACTMLATSAVYAHAQRPSADSDMATLYAAILRDLPAYYAGRAIVLDPRIAAASLRNGNPLDVWEHRLPDATLSPVVQGLHEIVEGITYCTDTPSRAHCLTSTKHVHVMFGAPFVEGSTTAVEVTVTFRAIEHSDGFEIQTWRYSFQSGPGGRSLDSRQLLARGHGRTGRS